MILMPTLRQMKSDFLQHSCGSSLLLGDISANILAMFSLSCFSLLMFQCYYPAMADGHTTPLLREPVQTARETRELLDDGTASLVCIFSY